MWKNFVREKCFGNTTYSRLLEFFLISWVILYLYIVIHSSTAPSPPKTKEQQQNKTNKENNSIPFLLCLPNKWATTLPRCSLVILCVHIYRSWCTKAERWKSTNSAVFSPARPGMNWTHLQAFLTGSYENI